jgi:hypothetical protein
MSKIKIFDKPEEQEDVYLYLRETLGPNGVSVAAKDRNGNHLYNILTVSEMGVHFHNLKNFVGKTPFPLSSASFDRDASRISISRM